MRYDFDLELKLFKNREFGFELLILCRRKNEIEAGVKISVKYYRSTAPFNNGYNKNMIKYKNILFVALMVALSNFCSAQPRYTAIATVRVKNCELLPFFDKKYRIDSVQIDYVYKMPEKLVISGTSDAGHLREVYLMNFSGDRYVLKSKYGEFVAPALPYSILNLQEDGKPIAFGDQYYKTKAVFTEEFVDYQFFWTDNRGSEEPAVPAANPYIPQYTAGIKQLRIDLLTYLEQHLEKEALERPSAFLLRGMVDRDKNMKNVQVVYSEDIKIAEVLKKCLERPLGAWIPELQGGGPVKSYIDVFINIRNSQLEVEICKSNRKL